MKTKINFGEFLEISDKLEIKVGCIKSASDVPKSDKLIRLEVDFGEENLRTVVTNIKPSLEGGYDEILPGASLLFVTNLEPVKMMGIESTAMIMPGFHDDFFGRVAMTNAVARPGTIVL